MKLNDSYFNTSTYNTVAWRNLVMCQEVGHTLTHFFRGGRLIALYVGRNAAVLAALRAVLGPPFAGAPLGAPLSRAAGGARACRPRPAAPA